MYVKSINVENKHIMLSRDIYEHINPQTIQTEFSLNISHLICILLLEPTQPTAFLRDILDKLS